MRGRALSGAAVLANAQGDLAAARRQIEESVEILRGLGEDAPLSEALARLPTFDVVSTEAALRAVAERRGVKAAALIHAVRVAITGKTVSPGLFEVLALVGRERTRARIGHDQCDQL